MRTPRSGNCLPAQTRGRKGGSGTDTGWIAVLIIAAVIVFSFLTRRCFECMLLGGLAGAVVLFGRSFLTQYVLTLVSTAADQIWLLLVCGLFGGLIALLKASKGSSGLTAAASRFCNTQRKTLLVSFVLGLVIFVDDYLNVLTRGACMKGLYDGRKIPRETLAYTINATAAPVCVLLPFSTWAVFYSGVFAEQEAVQAAGYSSGMQAYIHAIPFCFYPMAALVIVFLFSMGWMPKMGAMKKAFRRVEETGKLYSDLDKKFNETDEDPKEGGNLWFFLIPIAALIAMAVIFGDLLLALIIALVMCLVLYAATGTIPAGEFFSVVFKGFGDMVPLLFLLVACFTLTGIAEAMGMPDVIAAAVLPYLSRSLLPVITFVLTAVLTFVTGNLWGLSAIIAGIIFPIAAALDANVALIMAAIISGGAFGSHAGFYSDATLLTSTASGIDNIEYSIAQLPYVLIGLGTSVIAFLIAGFVI